VGSVTNWSTPTNSRELEKSKQLIFGWERTNYQNGSRKGGNRPVTEVKHKQNGARGLKAGIGNLTDKADCKSTIDGRVLTAVVFNVNGPKGQSVGPREERIKKTFGRTRKSPALTEKKKSATIPNRGGLSPPFTRLQEKKNDPVTVRQQPSQDQGQEFNHVSQRGPADPKRGKCLRQITGGQGPHGVHRCLQGTPREKRGFSKNWGESAENLEKRGAGVH